MKMISCEWNALLNKYKHTWLANDESHIPGDFDTPCAEGSTIFVIATEATFMKNCEGKWQKCGTTEVIGDNGGSTGGDTENWLFKDWYLEKDIPVFGADEGIPNPEPGVSYTLFWEGYELGTGEMEYDPHDDVYFLDISGYVSEVDESFDIHYIRGDWSARYNPGRYSLRING